MLRIIIAGALALAISGCNFEEGFGTTRPAGVSVSDWRGDLAEPVRRSRPKIGSGVRDDPKSPTVRRAAKPRHAIKPAGRPVQAPSAVPVSSHPSAPPREPAAIPAQPEAQGKASVAKAKKPCKPRKYSWQVWRPKACP